MFLNYYFVEDHPVLDEFELALTQLGSVENILNNITRSCEEKRRS